MGRCLDGLDFSFGTVEGFLGVVALDCNEAVEEDKTGGAIMDTFSAGSLVLLAILEFEMDVFST